MTKEFSIHIDVTMSGNVTIEAETEQEAIKKVKELHFVPSDLRNFYQLDTPSIVDIEEV